MSYLDQTRDDPRAALFAAMDDVHAGMLGVEGSGQHMAPMTHFHDPQTAEVWFITAADTDLVRAVGLGGRGRYCVVGKDQTFFACLTGALEQVEDKAKLHQLWSPVTSAWFKDGADDPRVVLLRLTLQDAAIWASTGNTLVFGFEIARANLSEDHTPDVGEHVVVRFDEAA